MPKVKFIKSPTCSPFYLGYSIGDEAEVKKELAQKLVDAEIAIPTAKPKRTAAKVQNKVENRG